MRFILGHLSPAKIAAGRAAGNCPRTLQCRPPLFSERKVEVAERLDTKLGPVMRRHILGHRAAQAIKTDHPFSCLNVLPEISRRTKRKCAEGIRRQLETLKAVLSKCAAGKPGQIASVAPAAWRPAIAIRL